MKTKEKSVMHILLKITDLSENESCDSDYEDNIPLNDYIRIIKNVSERSPTSCRTKTLLKEKPWVPGSKRSI